MKLLRNKTVCNFILAAVVFGVLFNLKCCVEGIYVAYQRNTITVAADSQPQK